MPPMRSSTLSPKMYRNHILLMTWNQPPCRNMAVKIVTHWEDGSLQKLCGINPHLKMNPFSAEGPICISYTNTSVLITIKRILMNGNLRERTVSYKGIIICKTTLNLTNLAKVHALIGQPSQGFGITRLFVLHLC